MLDNELKHIEALKSEYVTGAKLCKVYSQYQMRNEWVNWDGDTDLVNRSGKNVEISLLGAEQSSEIKRSQGAKFFIAEVPALYINTKLGGILITELFSKSPVSGIDDLGDLTKGITIHSLTQKLPVRKWSYIKYFTSHPKLDGLDGFYFLRKSSPGSGKNSLGWTLSDEELNEKNLQELCDKLNKVKQGKK
ncbi:MAG: hypothetical protein AXW17_10025 [Colwellia sp. Phe_37]|nr:MAG: hypothetical protein AXW17_10025 [Colwellia sp. Phe_37]